MQFYLFFPFLMLLARRMGLWNFSALVVAVWLAARYLIAVYVMNPPRLLGRFPQPSFLPLELGLFLIGILIGCAWMEYQVFSRRAVMAVLVASAVAALADILVLAVTLLLVFMLFFDESSSNIAMRRLKRGLGRVLGNRITHVMADVSYGVYLIHLLILIPLLNLLLTLQWFASSAVIVRFLVAASLVTVSTYLISWSLHKALERPGIEIGKNAARAVLIRVGLRRKGFVVEGKAVS
jgi:peptidoglycan/LPS O-acetylase OafA/YrhL